MEETISDSTSVQVNTIFFFRDRQNESKLQKRDQPINPKLLEMGAVVLWRFFLNDYPSITAVCSRMRELIAFA